MARAGVGCALLFGLLSHQPVAAAGVSAGESAPLDFEFFKNKVQPIFHAKRSGHARCVACHAGETAPAAFRLQPLTAGSVTWDEEQSRKNYEAAVRVVAPGELRSPLLVHPLAEEAGGDLYHSGGKHFKSQSDPEWQILKEWVFGQTGNRQVARILQTNSAGDNVDVIDPVTNQVVGVIEGIEVNHGVAAAPDGSRIYVSDEAGSTLDVVDGTTLKVTTRIPLSGHPNNLAVSPDARRVYVGIIEAPGGVDVIDTRLLKNIKTLPTKGTIHNAYVTPDGKYVVAGSIQAKTINVIDTRTDQTGWTLQLDRGIRPMAFAENQDGSTRWIFVQLTDFNGFAVVDFAAHKEIRRIPNPALAPGKSEVSGGADPSHGMAVTSNGKTLLVCSRLNNELYSYSIPDLKLTGRAALGGKGAAWVTITPEGETAYVSNAVTNDVSAIDIKSMKEVALIPVGYVPKRNTTAMLPAAR